MICLTYHSITSNRINNQINAGGKHVDIDSFEKQIKYISQKPLYNLRFDKLEENTKKILITIDDGFKNNYTNAFQILKHYNVPFVIFLCTSFLENKLIWTDRLLKLSLSTDDFYEKANNWLIKNNIKLPKAQLSYDSLRLKMKTVDNDMKNNFFRNFKDNFDYNQNLSHYSEIFDPLNWSEIKSMLSSDLCTIGAHTDNHPILSKCDYDEQYREIKSSKEKIEKELKHVIKNFAYPNGSIYDFNNDTKNILNELEFDYAFTTQFGYNKIFKPLEIQRIGVTSDLSFLKYKLIINRIWRTFA